MARQLQDPLCAPVGEARVAYAPVAELVADLPDAPLRASAPDRHVLPWQRSLVRTLIILDGAAALIASLLATAVRFGQGADTGYRLAVLLLPVLFVLSCACTRSYEPRFLGTGSEEFRRVADAGLRLLAVVAIASFSLHLSLARLWVLLSLPVTVALSLLFRYAARRRLHRQRDAGTSLHRVIVVGRERACADLVRQLRREPHAGFSVVGACIDTAKDHTVEGVPVLGTSRQVLAALHLADADTVAVGAWSDYNQQELRELSWALEGTGVDLVVAPSFTDIAGPRIHIRPVAGLPLLHVEEPEFRGGRRLLKGTFDRGVALAALLLIGPFLLALCVATRLTSPGPALFRQTRVGATGKTFTMLKVRSMHTDAGARIEALQELNERSEGLLFKVRDDPRVTAVGRVLRRYSLDELPQLVNVLMGDMSLVGPRPPLPDEVAGYGQDVHRRLLVKPGLTGLWQISGRSNLPWDESVRLDLYYVENWSLAYDLVILWKTAGAVLTSRGAY